MLYDHREPTEQEVRERAAQRAEKARAFWEKTYQTALTQLLAERNDVPCPAPETDAAEIADKATALWEKRY